jgi:hypothetical protein
MKSLGYGKGQKVKGVANKRSAIKSFPNKPKCHGGMVCTFGGVGDEYGIHHGITGETNNTCNK